jgi:hypothetical protein
MLSVVSIPLQVSCQSTNINYMHKTDDYTAADSITVNRVPADLLAKGDYVLNLGRVVELTAALHSEPLEVILLRNKQKLVWRFERYEHIFIHSLP